MSPSDQTPGETEANASGQRRRLHLREVSLGGPEPGETYDGVGAVLAAARASLRVDIDRAAHELRIRKGFIEAIETGRFDALPGQAYTQGFVRSYANYLNLDAEDILARLREETRARRDPGELVFPTPMAETRVPGLRVLLATLLIAGLVYVGWSMSSREVSVLEKVPPVPDQLLARTALDAKPAEAPPIPAPTPAAQAPAPQAPAPQAMAPQPLPAPQPAPPVQTATPAQSAPAPAAAAPTSTVPSQGPSSPPQSGTPQSGAPPSGTPATQAATATPDAGGKSRTYGATEGSTRIVLKANADSWVRVTEPGGATLLRRILRAGDAFNVPDRDDLTLAVGSAGAVDILVDGEPIPSLGKAGEIRRNIPLVPDTLKQGLPQVTKPGAKKAKKAEPAPEGDGASAETPAPATAGTATPANAAPANPGPANPGASNPGPAAEAPRDGAPPADAANPPKEGAAKEGDGQPKAETPAKPDTGAKGAASKKH